MTKFKTLCGEIYPMEVPADIPVMRLRLQRLYKDEPESNRTMPEKCQNCPAEKVFKGVSLLRKSQPGKTITAEDTFCVMKSEDYQESKLVEYFSSGASNTSSKMVIEVVLQSEEYRKVINIPYKYRGQGNAWTFMQYISDDLWELLRDTQDKDNDDESVVISMYSLDGDYLDDVQIDSQRDMEDTIVSLRVVEFKEEIIEQPKRSERSV